MVIDTLGFDDGRVSVHGEHVTLEQLDLIIRHFGRHATSVVGVNVDYDLHSEQLELSGIPTADASDERARSALSDAIAAAQYIRPSNGVDISA